MKSDSQPVGEGSILQQESINDRQKGRGVMSTDSAQRFPMVKKGYDPEAVDVYIENLGAKNQFLQGRIVELEKRIRLAEDLIESFSKAEDELRQNIADSKKAAASMILDAKERAAALLDEARAECGKIVSDLDAQVANRMQVLNVMRAQAAAFKDQLFDLYSSHIEMIESIANAAQSPAAQPDYSGIAGAVNTFEEAGEPQADVPAFTEYPKDSIFPKVEEAEEMEETQEDVPQQIEEGDTPSPREEHEEEKAPSQEEEAEEEEDDFFTGGDGEEEKIYPFDTESVSTPAEKTDYYQYLRDFTDKEEK